MSDRYDFLSMEVAPEAGAICDFCSSPDVHWSYPCRDHQRTEHLGVVTLVGDELVTGALDLDHFSAGGWAACNPCHALIARSDRERLARRSAKRALRMAPGSPIGLADLTAHIRRVQDQFWANRLGAPVYHQIRPRQDPTR